LRGTLKIHYSELLLIICLDLPSHRPPIFLILLRICANTHSPSEIHVFSVTINGIRLRFCTPTPVLILKRYREALYTMPIAPGSTPKAVPFNPM
jgi:hypothetical protein